MAAATGLVLTEIALKFFAVTSLFIAIFSNLTASLVLLAPSIVGRPGHGRGWPAAEWLRLAAAAAAVYALGFIFLYAAIDLIGTSKTSLLGRIEALFVICLAVLFLGERWSTRHWIGSFMALAGAAIITLEPGAWQLRLGLGELLCVAAAAVVATGIVLLKPLLVRRDGQFVTGVALLMGALWLAPFFLMSAAENSTTGPSSGPSSAWSPMILAVLLARGILLGISWVTYNVAMEYIGASRCSVLFLTVVLFTVVVQVSVDTLAPGLGLQVPDNLPAVIAGGGLIVLAIVLIQRA